MVQMVNNAFSSLENVSPISVCVQSGITGTMEVALTVSLTAAIGTAGTK